MLRKWLVSHPIHASAGTLLVALVVAILAFGLFDDDPPADADPDEATANYCYRNSADNWHKSEELIECWWGAYIGPNSNGSNYREAESTQIDLDELIDAVNAKWPDAEIGADTTIWLDAWGGSGGGIRGGPEEWGEKYLGGLGGMAQTITTPAALGARDLYWYQGAKGKNDVVSTTSTMGPGGGGAASLLTTEPISQAFASVGGPNNKIDTSNLSQYGVLLVAAGGGGGGGSGPCDNGEGAHSGGRGGGALATTAGPAVGVGTEGGGASSNSGHGGGPDGQPGGGDITGHSGFGGFGGHAHAATTATWTNVNAVDPGAASWGPAGQGAAGADATSGGGSGGGGYGGGGGGRSCFYGIGTSSRAAAGGGGGGSYAAASTTTDPKAPTTWVETPSSLPGFDLEQMNQYPTDAALIITFSLNP